MSETPGWVILAAALLGLAGGLLVVGAQRHIMERAAIERGCALHHPVTGNFTWKADLE